MDEHSLHSPFLYDLYINLIKRETISNETIEKLRFTLSKDHRELEYADLGAGSKHASGNKRKISDIAGKSLSDVKYSSLYTRLANYCKAKTIVELGTSLGINTLYLAQRKEAIVVTFEGADPVADIAELSFEFAQAKNIKLIRGNIDTTLYGAQSAFPKVDLAFFDANHRYEPTLRYFQWLLPKTHHKSIYIFDDIHDNAEMEKAWQEIMKNDLVYLSIDLYRCGIVFFDPSLTKQHVVLQF